MILSFVDTEMGPYTRRLVSTTKAPNVHLALGPSSGVTPELRPTVRRLPVGSGWCPRVR